MRGRGKLGRNYGINGRKAGDVLDRRDMRADEGLGIWLMGDEVWTGLTRFTRWEDRGVGRMGGERRSSSAFPNSIQACSFFSFSLNSTST